MISTKVTLLNKIYVGIVIDEGITFDKFVNFSFHLSDARFITT